MLLSCGNYSCMGAIESITNLHLHFKGSSFDKTISTVDS